MATDLQGTGFYVTNSIGLEPSRSIEIEFAIQNNVNTFTNQDYLVSFYLSENGFISSFDRFLGDVVVTQSLDAFDTDLFRATLVLPRESDSIWSGFFKDYYVGMIVDSTRNVGESNEGNNDNRGKNLDYQDIFVFPRSVSGSYYVDYDFIGQAFDFSQSQGWSSFDLFPRLLGDFNSDGLSDIIGFGSSQIVTSYSQGGSFSASRQQSLDFSQAQGWSSFDLFPRLIGDFDADGYDDIVGFGSNLAVFSYNNGNGTFDAPIYIAGEFTQAQGWSSFDAFPRLIGDFNGDGYDDTIGFGSTALIIQMNDNDSVGPKYVQELDFTQSWGWDSFDKYPRFVGDFNGDGRDDIIGFGSSHINTALGRGDGLFNPVIRQSLDFTQDQGWTSFDKYPRWIGDVNGDGLDDIVGFGDRIILAAFSNGDGTFGNVTYTNDIPLTVNNGGWATFDLFPRQLGDVSGDGFVDIVGFGLSQVFTVS